MLVDYSYAYPVAGILTPNWRERLTCRRCGLNSRMRGAVHLLEDWLGTEARMRLYLTEQHTPTAETLRRRHADVVCSEFVDDILNPGAITRDGTRHEDLTRLSFADHSFDRLVTLDVLEHVPHFERALAECWRVLAPHGRLFLTVPFLLDRRKNLVRARVGAAGLEYLEPPEYHGDPLRPDGSLAFYHFGWELLDALRRSGFRRVRLVTWWSGLYGYLGPNHVALVATR